MNTHEEGSRWKHITNMNTAMRNAVAAITTSIITRNAVAVITMSITTRNVVAAITTNTITKGAVVAITMTMSIPNTTPPGRFPV